MKKILTLLLVAFMAKAAFAQDEDKNFRFGLRATPSLNWYKPDDDKKFDSGGIRAKFGYGLITEFRLTKVASLYTGIGFDYDGGRIKFADDSATVIANYYVKNNEFIEIESGPNTTYGDTTKFVGQYRLRERTYNTNYVTLPIALKMKTKEIGMLTYFGMFGGNISFRTKAKVDDEYTQVKAPTTTSYDGKDMDNTKDMNIIKLAATVGGGAEYNLSGTTSLVFGLNVNLGLTNVAKGESRYLQEVNLTMGQNENKRLEQKFKANAVALTVGILF